MNKWIMAVFMTAFLSVGYLMATDVVMGDDPKTEVVDAEVVPSQDEPVLQEVALEELHPEPECEGACQAGGN